MERLQNEKKCATWNYCSMKKVQYVKSVTQEIAI